MGLCVNNDYCIVNTGYEFDGNYTSAGTYDGYSYWSSDTSPTYFIYYNTLFNQWCLSTSLGGACSMIGKTPCTSDCPDFCDEYLVTGICPSPTPTPTLNCDVLDFTALFDCAFTPTPTNTPTSTQTPTPTPTPTATDPCGYIGLDASITAYTPTQTPTPTMTPSNTPEINRPFNFSGDVTFNTVDGTIYCPNSRKFQDCFNGDLYWTISPITIELQEFEIFLADVDGYQRCISFLGVDNQVIGVNQVELLSGPLGFSNLGECVNCVAVNSPTPTNTPTITPTPSFTPTPTLPSVCKCHTFTTDNFSGYITYYDCFQEDFVNLPLLPRSSVTVCLNTTYTITKTNNVSYTVGNDCYPNPCSGDPIL